VSWSSAFESTSICRNIQRISNMFDCPSNYIVRCYWHRDPNLEMFPVRPNEVHPCVYFMREHTFLFHAALASSSRGLTPCSKSKSQSYPEYPWLPPFKSSVDVVVSVVVVVSRPLIIVLAFLVAIGLSFPWRKFLIVLTTNASGSQPSCSVFLVGSSA